MTLFRGPSPFPVTPADAHGRIEDQALGPILEGRVRSAVGRGNTCTALAFAVLLIASPDGNAADMDNLPGVALEPLARGLTAPVDIADPEDGTGRLLIAEQPGTIRVLEADGSLADRPWLDLRDRMVALVDGFEERGLLGVALHPDFAENGRFYVTYTADLRPEAPPGWNYTRRVSEFTADPDAPDWVDPQTERVLLSVDWPSRKHNGGGLAFGPDGFLYIGLGDGGGAHGVGQEVSYDAFEVPDYLRHWDDLAQDTTSLFGSILRLDVDRGQPGYAVPPANPLQGAQGRAEIYAWGFRNPYRIAFDPAGHEGAFVNAVAETLWEALYLVDRPGNYGWAVKEASHCFDRAQPLNPPAECVERDRHGYRLRDPIIEYPNRSMERADIELSGLREERGTANVGGRIYRGTEIAALDGKLVFADWSRDFEVPSGQLFVAHPPDRHGDPWPFSKLLETDGRIISLGQDARGEVYVLTNETLGPYGETGEVHRLIAEDDGRE